MAGKSTEGERMLLAYMTGWKCGATGGATTARQAKDKAFVSGHIAGRHEMLKASGWASALYGATLNPMRGGKN